MNRIANSFFFGPFVATNILFNVIITIIAIVIVLLLF